MAQPQSKSKAPSPPAEKPESQEERKSKTDSTVPPPDPLNIAIAAQDSREPELTDAQLRRQQMDIITEGQGAIMGALKMLMEMTPAQEQGRDPYCTMLGQHDAAVQFAIRVLHCDGEAFRMQGNSSLMGMLHPKLLSKSVTNFHGIVHNNIFHPLSLQFGDWIQTFRERASAPLALPAPNGRLPTTPADSDAEDSDLLASEMS